MMLACDIPIHKLSHPSFKNFIERYAKQKVPSVTAVRKSHLDEIYQQVLQEIRDEIGDSNIYLSIDETIDKAGRCICNVVVGSLSENSRPYLLTSEEIEKVNSSQICIIFENALSILWPLGLKREKVLIFVTDAATYMKKCGDTLKLLFPKMIHITCIAHGTHRVCEEIRCNYPEVDALISNVKKNFRKSPARISFFREKLPGLALPPKPVLTRWGTWLSAALYYANNLSEIKGIVDELDENDAIAIKSAKQLLKNDNIPAQLGYIKVNFGFLADPNNGIFKKLQRRDNSIGDVMDVLNAAETNFKTNKGAVSALIYQKFKNILSKNTDLHIIKAISNVVNGVTNAKLPPSVDVKDIDSLNGAPLVSAEVERTFSIYKSMLRDNRMSFSAENFKKHIVVSCYYNMQLNNEIISL